MKIAVFGDSFADESPILTPDFIRDKNIPWVQMLRELTTHEVTNMAVLGSSFQYSAKLFLDCYKEYDKIVFVVTFPGRTHLTNKDVVSEFKHVANIEHLFSLVSDYKKSIPINQMNRTQDKLDRALPFLNALREYYLYVYDYDQAKLFHDALYEKIERTLPKEKLLILPVINFAASNYKGITFCDIEQLDSRPTAYFTNDNRPNHLNKRNRTVLANKINDWINTGTFDASIADFFPPTETMDQLFTRLDTPKDFAK